MEKGVSPVIATVLLIGMVIVISLIVFLWFQGLTTEAVTKFDKNVELVCEEVQFRADYSNNNLAISNIGNVPIYDMKVKFESGGNFETKNLRDITSLTSSGLNQGRVFSDDLGSETEGKDSFTLIPVLVGSGESGQRVHICDEGRFGQKINL